MKAYKDEDGNLYSPEVTRSFGENIFVCGIGLRLFLPMPESDIELLPVCTCGLAEDGKTEHDPYCACPSVGIVNTVEALKELSNLKANLVYLQGEKERLNTELTSALAILDKVRKDIRDLSPSLFYHLRDETREFYQPRLDTLDAQIRVLSEYEVEHNDNK